MTLKLLKFHGKFKDLIPYGFKFQKLFANNYRQYCLQIGSEYSSTCIRVWQHHGGYIEFNDFHETSYHVFNALNNPNFQWIIKHGFYKAIINRNDGTVIPYVPEQHNAIWIMHNARKEGKTEQETDILVDNCYDSFRECLLTEDLIKAIKGLQEKNWIIPEP